MNGCLAVAQQKNVKIVVNAGGLNPAGCAAKLLEIADEQGLGVSIAHVEGDNLLDRSAELGFGEVLTANAYLGVFGIAAALDAGADIVVTGRVADASVIVGPAISHFDWQRDDLDELAGAVAAGHVIECGTQETGLADEAFAAGKVHTAPLGERLEALSVSTFDESVTHRYALAAAIADARKRSEEATVLGRVPTAFRNVPSQPRTRTYRRGETDIAVTYENRRDRLIPVGWDRTRVIHADPQRIVIDHEGIVEAFDVALGSQIDIGGPAGSMTLEAVPDFLDPAEVVAEGSLLATDAGSGGQRLSRKRPTGQQGRCHRRSRSHEDAAYDHRAQRRSGDRAFREGRRPARVRRGPGSSTRHRRRGNGVRMVIDIMEERRTLRPVARQPAKGTP